MDNFEKLVVVTWNSGAPSGKTELARVWSWTLLDWLG